jgi:uncharacterized protein YcfL
MSHTRNLVTACIAIVSIGWAAGCTSTDPYTAKTDPVPHYAYPQVETIGDANKHVLVSQPVVTGGGHVPLSVSVPIRSNLSGRDLNVQYQFTFFDAVGNVVEPQMTWMPQRLLPRSQVMVRAAAIDTNAVDWRLSIRIGR